MPSRRVFVRTATWSDEQEFLEVRRSSLLRFRPWLEAAVLTADDLYGPANFTDYMESIDGIRMLQYLICERPSGRIVGGIKLKNISRGNEQYAILSYWIGAAYSDQKYVSEGIIEMAEVAFSELGLHRLEANISLENMASIGAIKRAGFELEGTCRKFAKIGDDWIDHARFALIADS